MVNMATEIIAKVDDGPAKRCTESFVSRARGFVTASTIHTWEAALPHLHQSIKCLPWNATSLYLVGMAALEQGNPQEAVDFMTKSVMLDLDYKVPYVNLGVAYLRLQRYDDAITVSES